MLRHLSNLALLLAFVAARPAAAQPAEDTLRAWRAVGRFEDARALGVDPAGVLYVVDAGRSTVERLLPDGTRLEALGGPGAGEQAFHEPADVDPTNGLVLVVADAGNGRLKRFSREFRFLEALPLDRLSDPAAGAGRSGYAEPFADPSDGEPGRPVAVAAGPGGELFAVDEVRRVVVKWDAARRVERLVGGYGAAGGSLADPVGLAVDPRGAVYVADRGRSAVVVYDLFGGFVRTLGELRLSDVRAVSFTAERLLVSLPRRLLVYDARGTLLADYAVELPAELVDAVVDPSGRMLYALTRTALYAAPLDA